MYSYDTKDGPILAKITDEMAIPHNIELFRKPWKNRYWFMRSRSYVSCYIKRRGGIVEEPVKELMLIHYYSPAQSLLFPEYRYDWMRAYTIYDAQRRSSPRQKNSDKKRILIAKWYGYEMRTL